MANISDYIKSNLLEPLKRHSTAIQDTMIELIAQKLQELYDYAVKFPEIITPDKNRLDILKAIADQFLFAIRDDADIEEQISILENILHVYNKRGSIDTIENMWRYYGGKLPKDVEVVIPSYNLFRYSISALSGTHVFQDGGALSITVDTPAPVDIPGGTLIREIHSTRYRVTTGIVKGATQLFLTTTDGLSAGDRLSIGDIYEATITSVADSRYQSLHRTGVYEVRLTNNTYPIPDLKEFLVKELVAAGNYIYFTNIIHADLSENSADSNYYKYDIADTDILLDIDLEILKSKQGLLWGGSNPLSPNMRKFTQQERDSMRDLGFSDNYIEGIEKKMSHPRDAADSLWSGKENIFIDLSQNLELYINSMNNYSPVASGIYIIQIPNLGDIKYEILVCKQSVDISSELSLSYRTLVSLPISIETHLYDKAGNPVESEYPGYFVLGKSLLGT